MAKEEAGPLGPIKPFPLAIPVPSAAAPSPELRAVVPFR